VWQRLPFLPEIRLVAALQGRRRNEGGLKAGDDAARAIAVFAGNRDSGV